LPPLPINTSAMVQYWKQPHWRYTLDALCLKIRTSFLCSALSFTLFSLEVRVFIWFIHCGMWLCHRRSGYPIARFKIWIGYTAPQLFLCMFATLTLSYQVVSWRLFECIFVQILSECRRNYLVLQFLQFLIIYLTWNQ